MSSSARAIGSNMARVWYGVPSGRQVEEAQACFDAWRDMGYAVAATRKEPDLRVDHMLCLPKYPGLWVGTNELARAVLAADPECEIFVTGGDDVYPDQTQRADEIADEFIAHFGGTLGVMQPTGDRLPWSPLHCCWAPWLGREWCRRAFLGRGPAEPSFWHYYGDYYLRLAAERLGLLWVRPDLTQEHRKWRKVTRRRPEHLVRSKQMWQTDKDLCHVLVSSGFIGADLLPEDQAA